MFNNPFDSFHDTVSEAKKERDQLDVLLTISTPRERLLNVVILIVLVMLGAWLVFGEVPRSIMAPDAWEETSEELAANAQSGSSLGFSHTRVL